VFKIKRDEKGNIAKHKARLVAKGTCYLQWKGLLFILFLGVLFSENSFHVWLSLCMYWTMIVSLLLVRCLVVSSLREFPLRWTQSFGIV
jgi:hypothetical protein